jgi:DNA invertase Pin-like site-specific DNA recombinase
MAPERPEATSHGYARVSSDAQALGNQVAQIKAAGCAPAAIFREKMTDTHADRPQLKKLMGRLTAGDVVIIRRFIACRATRPISW